MNGTIRLTMSQALVKFLDSQYVSFDNKEYKFIQGMFGIFGHGNVTGIGEALENLDLGFPFYQGHNEQGMVHAAVAFAKQRRRLSIMACTSSIGPGALNMVTGAGVATTNRIPVLLLPGDIFASRVPDPVLQQVEQPYDYNITANDAFKPVSKYWDRINRPEQLISAMENAMRVLTDPVDTGAVTICLPQDVQGEAYDYPETFFKKRTHYIERRRPSKDTIKRVAIKIANSKRPFIIAGGGVHYSAASPMLESFVNKFAIPVASTQAGKGCINSDCDFDIGGLGVTGTQAANNLAKEADLILALGTRLSDFTTCSKTAFNDDVSLIQVNVNSLDATKLNAMPVLSDVGEMLKELENELNLLNYTSSCDYQNKINDEKELWQLEVNKCFAERKYSDGLSQTQVLGAINSLLKPEDIIVCAAGSLPGDLHRLWQVKQSDSYHLEYGFSCMGYEVSGGLGVKMASRTREVFVLVGDGSFLMLHTELLTSIQESCKVNIILFDNHGYGCIRKLQMSTGSLGFGNEFRKRNNSSNHLDGETLDIDFEKYAQALGAKSYAVSDIKELPEVIQKVKEEKLSTITVIPVSKDSMSGGYNSWWQIGPWKG